VSSDAPVSSSAPAFWHAGGQLVAAAADAAFLPVFGVGQEEVVHNRAAFVVVAAAVVAFPLSSVTQNMLNQIQNRTITLNTQIQLQNIKQ